MGRKSDGDISNQGLLEALNAAFGSVQTQIDQLRDENTTEHAKTRQEVQLFREENVGEHESITRKLDGTIKRVDTFDRRLKQVEARPA